MVVLYIICRENMCSIIENMSGITATVHSPVVTTPINLTLEMVKELSPFQRSLDSNGMIGSLIRPELISLQTKLIGVQPLDFQL